MECQCNFPVQKKGIEHRSETSNYRCIGLSNSVYMIQSKIINNKLWVMYDVILLHDESEF